MELLDKSQREFCQAPVGNIRLLAPAGCGKTLAPAGGDGSTWPMLQSIYEWNKDSIVPLGPHGGPPHPQNRTVAALQGCRKWMSGRRQPVQGIRTLTRYQGEETAESE